MELQEDVAEICERNFKLNKAEEQLTLIQDSILEWSQYFKKHSLDVVISNPPYKAKDSGILNETDSKTISRHEQTATLKDFISVAAGALNSQGKFFMIHRPQRLTEIFKWCAFYELAVKRLVFVHGKPGSRANMVLIKAVKKGKGEVLVDTPLYIHHSDGTYTEKIHEIYGEMWTGGF